MKDLAVLLLFLSLASLLTLKGCYCQLPDISDPCSRSATQLRDEDIAYFPSFFTPSPPSDTPPPDGDTPSNRRKRAATSIRELLWPDGIIPYTISYSYSEFERRLILEAMQHWENHTCIRFHARTNHRDFINVFPGSGCCSYVGRVAQVGNGLQGVSIGRSCFNFHTAVHELGHVIGFWHEQSRPDRNQYIDVLHAHILPGFEPNFNPRSQSEIDSLGIGYDYNSIMHYDADFFTRHELLDTLRARDPSIVLGKARELSKLDIIQTNLLYNCDVDNPPARGIYLPPLPATPPPPLPRLPYHCGEVMLGTNGTFQSPGFPTYPHNLDCMWIIKAPEGYKVKLNFEPLRIEYSFGCSQDFIRIHSDMYRRDVGRTACGIYYRYQYVTSANEAAIHLRTDHDNAYHSQTTYTGFQASFSVVDINECFEFRINQNAQRRCSQLCQNLPGSYECSCRDGFYLSSDGLTCFDVNECALGNGGCDHSCHNVGGSYYCTCYDGYELQPDQSRCRLPGTSCSFRNGECSQNCTETPTSKVCSCYQGYELGTDEKSCFDINECASYPRPCDHACVNIRGSYRCDCWLGFYVSEDGHSCIPERTCDVDNGGCGQLCEDSPTRGAVCSCRDGYNLERDGRTCVDINECISTRTCQYRCENTNGSYICSCPLGYALRSDQRSCEDLDECTVGVHECQFSDYCMNLRGSYYCSCPLGYRLNPDGRNCDDLDECAYNYHRCSHICHNLPGTYECACPDGYALQDFETCLDIDECATNMDRCNRLSEATCENTVGSYICRCLEGYRTDDSGFTCVDIDECTEGQFTCNGNTVCVNLEGDYMCGCPDGQQLTRDRTFCELSTDAPHTTMETTDAPHTTMETTDAPHTTTDVPQTTMETTDVPQTTMETTDIPQTTLAISTTATDERQTTTIGSQTTEETKETTITTKDEPKTTMDEPKTTTDGPKTTADGPKTTADGPKMTTDGPKTTTDGPKTTIVTTDEPKTTTDKPKTTSDEPQTTMVTTEEPKTTTDEPKTTMVTTEEPKTTTDEPKMTTNEPETTTQSQATTASESTTTAVDEVPSTTSNDEQIDSTASATTIQTSPPLSTTTAATEESTTQVSVTPTVVTTPSDDPLPGEVGDPLPGEVGQGSLICNRLKCDHVCHTTVEGVATCLCRVGYQLNEDERTCEDIDECIDSNDCGQACRNTQGSYECICSTGYKLNEDGKSCNDIDECFDNQGGCSHFCTNTEGSYSCNCRPLHYIDSDGHTCIYFGPPTTPPPTTTTPTTVTTPTQTTTQSHPSTASTHQSPPTSTPSNSTALCGGQLTAPSGHFHTPNWPETYPVNFDCEWTMTVSEGKVIEITFNEKPYGIAGKLPLCPKDWIMVYDGLDISSASSWGPFCQFRNPEAIQSSSNQVKVLFHAGPRHNKNKTGFRARYREIDPLEITNP